MMTFRLKARLFARSLLLQSCWSYERMQGLGFAYSIEPFVGREQARARHLEFFNTQPFVAPLVLGMSCALEEQARALPEPERSAKLARLKALKSGAACALAAVADSLFWGSLRPMCAALGWLASLVVTRTHGAELGAGAAALVYLISYNVPSLWTRWKGLELGYAWGERLAVELKNLRPRALIRRTAAAGALATLACAGLLLQGEARPLVAGAALAVFIALPLAASKLYAGSALLGAAAAAAGWI